jgi:integrase
MTSKGRIFKRGAIWWIAYSRKGHEFRESADTTDVRKARLYLQRRLGESSRPEFVGPSENRLDLEDLERKIEADYVRHGRRSLATVKQCLKPAKEFFHFDRLVDIGASRIDAYQDYRLKKGKARATVNREVRYLLHGFKLLFDAHEISFVPRVKLLEGENVREGFINRPEFEAAAEQIQNEDTRDIVRFLYLSAWRSGEAKKLDWSKVDTNDWVIRLSRRDEKTKRPRTLVLVDELREIIEKRLAKRTPECPYVFHRQGKPIKSFQRAFKTAFKHVGLEGTVPHDLRRSGVRNFTKAGLSESEGMSISGHRTNAIYKRYNIIDEDLQRESLERVAEQQKREIARRKVVPLRKIGSRTNLGQKATFSR